MIKFCLFAITALLILSAPEPSRAAGTTLLRPTSADEYRTRFTFLTEGWQATDTSLVGAGPRYHSLPETAPDEFPVDFWTYFVARPVNLWRYAVAGMPEWTDYTLTTTLTIEQPAPLEGFRPGEAFYNYQWGREAIGSDAGLIVRYQDPDNYYMVRLSSGYGHIELWKTHGGVVQVKPYRLEPGRPYSVRVTASGRWILVSIDGEEILRYADPVLPVRNGLVGFGVRESRVRFADVQVTPTTHRNASPPAHTPDFRLRKWVGRDYIFDGDEPVGFVGSTMLYEMKFRPGLMPMLNAYLGMQCWESASEGDYKVNREGEVLSLTANLQDKDGVCTNDATWELSYNPERGYVWDKRATFAVFQDDALNNWPELDDSLFYQIVAPVTDKLPKCRTELNYTTKQLADGTISAFPTAGHLWIDGAADSTQAVIRPGGVQMTSVEGWGVCTELPLDNDHLFYTTYCHWGLDLHLCETTGHVRFYVWDPARVQQELSRGVLPPPNRPIPAQLINHVEPLNHCDSLYPGLTGESVRLWTGNYTVDHTVGRGDSTSMRIEAAAITRRLDRAYGDERPNTWLGASYWTGPYLAPRYRLGLWIKADEFTGKVVFQADSFAWIRPDECKQPVVAAELAIDGKCDWTYVSFEGTFPRHYSSWVLRLDPVGTGVVWVDDIEVSPLPR